MSIIKFEVSCHSLHNSHKVTWFKLNSLISTIKPTYLVIKCKKKKKTQSINFSSICIIFLKILQRFQNDSLDSKFEVKVLKKLLHE